MEFGSGITYLAETRVKGETKRFGIKDADRTHHIALIGKDGDARAAFLANMALQDIARGAGVLVMDAEGTFVRLLLERFPQDAAERLIVLDPSDGEYPYSWNPLADFRALPREAAPPVLARTLADMYQCEDGQLTGFAAAEMLKRPDATFLFLYAAVADPKARDSLLPKGSPERATFEATLAASGDMATSLKEYGQYLGKDTLVRNLLGQTQSKFTLEVLSAGGIVVVDLSRIRMFPTRVTPLSRLILSACRARAHSPVAAYLNECLRFLSPQGLEGALLDRTVAFVVSDTSHGEPGTLRERLLARAGTLAAFAPQEDDVHIAGRAFYPYVAPEELEKLEEGKLVVALTIDSVRSRPFFASALPLPERSGVSVQDLTLSSRGKYTITRLAADKLFKPPVEAASAKKPSGDSFSGAFRSMFTKPAGAAASAPPAQQPEPAAGPAPRPSAPPAAAAPVPEKSVSGTVSPSTREQQEIKEDVLKKMLHVRKPPQ